MATIGSARDYLILTNNPLVVQCMDGKGRYTIEYHEGFAYRDILVLARDLIFKGRLLYTHPLAGSVKPGETPYKSVVVSRAEHGMETEHVLMIGSALEAYEKFRKFDWTGNDRVLRDFQLIDYTLLAGAVGFDAEAGLSNISL